MAAATGIESSGGPSPCVHCGRRVAAAYRRGLCDRCHRTAGVRALYPRPARPDRLVFGSRGLGLGNADPPPPAEPTPAAQGSEEKIRVLAARCEAGVGLFHPRDGAGLE